MSFAYVKIQTADGHSAKQLADLLRMRQEWLGETARQSVEACAVETLRSLRAQTKPGAKANSVPVNVQLDPELEVSFTTRGKHRAPCFRKGKTRWIPPKHTYLRFADVSKGSKAWAASWKPLNKSHSITYVVAAKSKAQAKAAAKASIKKTLKSWSGLAKAAIGRLLGKASSFTAGSSSNAVIGRKADQETSVVRRSSGRVEYQMQLVDSLVYAALALKDGPISIERALQAASNKIAATVNRKCSNLLLFKKLETPFPKGKAR